MRTDHVLSNFELMVILAVIRLDDAYGAVIAREIQTHTRRPVALASMYAALERMEVKGFVVSEWGDPTPERGGRAKKHFRVTARGLREIRRVKKSLVSLWNGLPQLEGGTL